jgi:hypothetical protein
MEMFSARTRRFEIFLTPKVLEMHIAVRNSTPHIPASRQSRITTIQVSCEFIREIPD